MHLLLKRDLTSFLYWGVWRRGTAPVHQFYCHHLSKQQEHSCQDRYGVLPSAVPAGRRSWQYHDVSLRLHPNLPRTRHNLPHISSNVSLHKQNFERRNEFLLFPAPSAPCFYTFVFLLHSPSTCRKTWSRGTEFHSGEIQCWFCIRHHCTDPHNNFEQRAEIRCSQGFMLLLIVQVFEGFQSPFHKILKSLSFVAMKLTF